MYSMHPELMVEFAKNHHEELRRAAGEARLRRDVSGSIDNAEGDNTSLPRNAEGEPAGARPRRARPSLEC